MLMVYVNAMGGKLRFSILMSWFLLVELCRVGATVWLSYWTGISDKPGMSFWHVLFVFALKKTTVQGGDTASSNFQYCCAHCLLEESSGV